MREQRDQLLRAVRDTSAELTLELSRVEADRQPNVFWEVYVGLPKGAAATPDSPHFVGSVALFGHGVHDAHQHDGFKPVAFSLRITRAVQAALTRDDSDALPIAFVARGAQMSDQRAAVRSEVTLTIGAAQFATRRATSA